MVEQVRKPMQVSEPMHAWIFALASRRTRERGRGVSVTEVLEEMRDAWLRVEAERLAEL